MLADRIGGFTAIALVGAVGVLCATAYLGLRSSTTPLLPAYTARSSFGVAAVQAHRCGAWSSRTRSMAPASPRPCPCSRWSTSTGWACRWARSASSASSARW